VLAGYVGIGGLFATALACAAAAVLVFLVLNDLGDDAEQAETDADQLAVCGRRPMESTDRPEDHWLALPFLWRGPSGPTQRDFQPAV
jgi:hypothetical protein